MSVFLTGLLVVLKCLGMILLILLVLLLVLLIMPVGVEAVWKPTEYAVCARLGPVRLHLLPKKEKPNRLEKKKNGKADKRPSEQSGGSKSEADKKTADGNDTKKETTDNPDKPKGAKPKKAEEPEQAQEQEKEQEKKQDEGVTAALKSLVSDTLADLKREPLETISRLLDMAAPLGAQLLHNAHIRHLRIVWTVTREDAAETAIAYGQEITLCNVLLTRAKQILNIQADELRLEPDFAGKMVDMRHLSCQITVMPCIILIIGVRLIWRILHSHPHSQKSE